MQKTNSRNSLKKKMQEPGHTVKKKNPQGTTGGGTRLSYNEKIPPGKKTAKNQDSLQVPAHELFNLFTADIIKKDTLFTR